MNKFINFTIAQAIIPLITAMRPIFFREKHSSMYTTFSYYVARTVADVPFVIVQTFLLVVIMYWISGLRSDDHGM